MKTKLTEQDIDLAYNLLSAGLSQTQIAAYFEVTAATLRKHIIITFGELPEACLGTFISRFMHKATSIVKPAKTPAKILEEGTYYCKTPDNKTYKCRYDSRGIYSVAFAFNVPQGFEVQEVDEKPEVEHHLDLSE